MFQLTLRGLLSLLLVALPLCATAFSFDIIPSSQIDNPQIIKSPAPEYPADFSGGFILIDTKEIPGGNTTSVSLSAAVNDQTHWQTAPSACRG